MRELQEYPIVIGEWSLAIGSGAQPGQLSKSEMRKRFAHAQLAAYAQASHGWFFWTWHDSHGAEWDWQLSQKDGMLSRTMINDPPPLELPFWDGNGEDPLEADFDSIPIKSEIKFGDKVFFRAFNGRYLNVQGSNVCARYYNRGEWQKFTITPHNDPPKEVSSQSVRDGELVCLKAHTGHYLSLCKTNVTVKRSRELATCVFLIKTTDGKDVGHRSHVFLQGHTNSKVLNANGYSDEIAAEWDDFGTWQKLTIEKFSEQSPERFQQNSCMSLPSAAFQTPEKCRMRSASPAMSSCSSPTNSSLHADILTPPVHCCGQSPSNKHSSPVTVTTPKRRRGRFPDDGVQSSHKMPRRTRGTSVGFEPKSVDDNIHTDDSIAIKHSHLRRCQLFSNE